MTGRPRLPIIQKDPQNRRKEVLKNPFYLFLETLTIILYCKTKRFLCCIQKRRQEPMQISVYLKDGLFKPANDLIIFISLVPKEAGVRNLNKMHR